MPLGAGGLTRCETDKQVTLPSGATFSLRELAAIADGLGTTVERLIAPESWVEAPQVRLDTRLWSVDEDDYYPRTDSGWFGRQVRRYVRLEIMLANAAATALNGGPRPKMLRG